MELLGPGTLLAGSQFDYTADPGYDWSHYWQAGADDSHISLHRGPGGKISVCPCIDQNLSVAVGFGQYD